ncbi:MAG: 30S ribosomal protein S21 [Oscillatoria princeps RMCB-10]|nr:30S ribosomal protein S21 [Oscillatoria princeps RMCB-10]
MVALEVKTASGRRPSGENESIDSALRRFNQKIQKAGILSDLKHRER